MHNPAYATVVGLLKYASEHDYHGSAEASQIEEDVVELDKGKSKKKVVSSVKGWFSNNF